MSSYGEYKVNDSIYATAVRLDREIEAFVRLRSTESEWKIWQLTGRVSAESEEKDVVLPPGLKFKQAWKPEFERHYSIEKTAFGHNLSQLITLMKNSSTVYLTADLASVYNFIINKMEK